jgi:hypothetical protein
MTLATIQKLDPDKASKVLAAAAIATSWDPGFHIEDPLHTQFEDEARSVLDEIRQKLRISESDTSVKATKAIDAALAKAIASATLEGVDKEALLNRIGQAGRLSPRLYTVGFTEQFNAIFSKLGVKRRRVEESIQKPSEYQHLLTKGASSTDHDDISIFLRRWPDHWFLVQSQRHGKKQFAQSAWFVYPTDVDLSEATQPIEVLEKFVLTYGLPFKVNGEEHRFLTETTAKKGVNNYPLGETFWSVSMRNPNEIVPEGQIGIAYCIDIPKYRDAIKRHGIRITGR